MARQSWLTPRLLLSHPRFLIALGFGAGLSPVWPGTAGSIIGFALYWLMGNLPPVLRAGTYVALFAFGAWCCQDAGRILGEQDHRSIVWDEIIGMSLVLEFIPRTMWFWIAGFILFRVIDATKPWPINRVHNAPPNGLLVMLDDVLAAAYALVPLLLCRWLSGSGIPVTLH